MWRALEMRVRGRRGCVLRRQRSIAPRILKKDEALYEDLEQTSENDRRLVQDRIPRSVAKAQIAGMLGMELPSSPCGRSVSGSARSSCRFLGGHSRIRTYDFHRVKVALYR